MTEPTTFWEVIQPFLLGVGIFMLISFVLFLSIIGFAVRQVRQINIPADADFTQTLRLAPFSIVLAIDLLDFSLDIFAAPVAWIILDRLGLKALRGMSVVEALLPFTQPIPTLTVCWIAVNWFKIDFSGMR